MVRPRLPGDIEIVFPDADVSETQSADYRYRASVPRKAVASKLSAFP